MNDQELVQQLQTGFAAINEATTNIATGVTAVGQKITDLITNSEIPEETKSGLLTQLGGFVNNLNAHAAALTAMATSAENPVLVSVPTEGETETPATEG